MLVFKRKGSSSSSSDTPHVTKSQLKAINAKRQLDSDDEMEEVE